MSAGASQLRDSVSGPNGGTLDGLGAAVDVLIGGTVARNLTLGGGMSFASAERPQEGGRADAATVSYGIFGAYADWYPDSKAGFHLSLLLGVAKVDVTPNPALGTAEGNEASSFSGLGVAPSMGYEWWIGEQWSFGVAGRLSYLDARNRERVSAAPERHRVVAPSLLATFVLH